MKLTALHESRIFQLPPEALQLVSSIKARAATLRDTELLGELPDPFGGKNISVYAVSADEYKRRGFSGSGSAGTIEGTPVVLYRLPITDTDTIYHELVHAYDPKFRRGLSRPRRSGGVQDMTTAHEVDAYVSGKLDQARDRLEAAAPEQQGQLLAELLDWLRRSKSEEELEPYNLPELLRGMAVHHLYKDTRLWRQFVQRVASTLGLT